MKQLQALMDSVQQSALWQKLRTLPLVVLIAGGAGLLALVVVAILWSAAPNHQVLFSGLSDKDGGQIVEELNKLKIPYTVAQGGSAILIPADKVHETRLSLASQGLPKGGDVGFELMGQTRFGASQFSEQMTYQRAIEGELARSIESINEVQHARVHLAIAKPTLFVRDKQEPSASVVLQLHAGRTLGEGQVQAIAWLVSSSVPNLTPESISIVDQRGALLSTGAGASAIKANDARQKLTREIEQTTVQRILAILSPLVGPGNVHAQASAQLDFNEREKTIETYRPNEVPDKAAVRSKQTSLAEQIGSGPAQGVPGALTNQPPPNATAPITQTGEQPPQPPQSAPRSTQDSSTINYEVDRTIEHVKASVGNLQRLTVAVVLNYKRNEINALVPYTAEELARIDSLIKQAMGFTEERGDSLQVLNSVFEDPAARLQIWENPIYQEMALEALKYLLIFIAAILAYRKVVSPVVRKVTQIGLAQEMEPATIEPPTPAQEDTHQSGLNRAKELSMKDPRAVAMVIRTWMEQEK